MCLSSLSESVLSVHKRKRMGDGLGIALLRLDDSPMYLTFPSHIVDMLEHNIFQRRLGGRSQMAVR